jgi:polysaccharide deacetylase 2 family uncharacterized protein YibQ
MEWRIMALPDTVTNALDKVRGLFRREPKAMDAFGGDDLFDGDGEEGEDGRNLGPKIALAVSGVMLLALVSLVGAIVMTGDESVSSGGSLADIQIEEDPDPTAATDRSAERRPWLTPTDAGTAAPRRLGMDDPKPNDGKAAATPAKPTTPAPTQVAKVEPPKAEPAKADANKAPTDAKPADLKPADAKPAEVKAPEIKTAEVKAPDAKAGEPKPAETTVAAATPAKAPVTPTKITPAADEKSEEEKEASVPSLLAPAETAPGAPRRFDVAAETGQTAPAGGRPRLNEPKLPPTDKASINAPPPRFNAVAEIKAPSAEKAGPKVAIVVEGLGLNRQATEAALAKLPPSVTLAFSPYARDLKRLLERAKAKGHEVLIEVPMESKNFPAEDPGPLGLLTGLESKDNQERLDTILKEATGAVGVFDGMGSKFRESPTNIGEVLAKLKSQNLFYVQGRPGVRATEAELPSATTDVVIDERPFRAAVDARFDYAEKIAKYQGTAVAVMAARPVSFERLALWMDQLPKKGVSVAPVSQVLVQ